MNGQLTRYDLERDGVLSEHELELAMEEGTRSSWRKATELLATHPRVYKRILLVCEIERDIGSGTFQQTNIYRYV
jgi:Zn-dependent protease with chaperone function